MRGLAEFFGKTHTVCSLDLPGHGVTPLGNAEPTLEAFALAIGIKIEGPGKWHQAYAHAGFAYVLKKEGKLDEAESPFRIAGRGRKENRPPARSMSDVTRLLSLIQHGDPDAPDRLLAVHEALDRLAACDAQKAELVKLRYFAGLGIEETAMALGISERTAKRHWTCARAWRLDAMRCAVEPKSGQLR